MININSFKWKVKFNDTALDSGCFAYVNYKDLTIYVGNEAKNDDAQLMYHLRHEVTHAFLYSYGFKTKENFTVEELCDFVGANAGKILELATILFNELKEEKPHLTMPKVEDKEVDLRGKPLDIKDLYGLSNCTCIVTSKQLEVLEQKDSNAFREFMTETDKRSIALKWARVEQ